MALERKIEFKSNFQTKEKHDGLFINKIQIDGKLLFSANEADDMNFFCGNDRELAGQIGQAMELKLKEFLQKIRSLSYKYSGDEFVEAVENVLITTPGSE